MLSINHKNITTPMTNDPNDFIKVLFIALGGGLARYLDGYLRGDKFNFWRLLARMVSSGFFGWFGAEIVGKYNTDFAYIAAGIAGFGGAEIASILIRIFFKFIGKQVNVEVTEKDFEPLDKNVNIDSELEISNPPNTIKNKISHSKKLKKDL